MIYKYGQYTVDIDVEKTKAFYARARRISEVCPCDGCTNFERAVKILPKDVASVFSALGIEPEKVAECYVNTTNPDGTLMYGGFCHVGGTMPEGEFDWPWEDDAYAVGANFRISFRRELSLLEDDFPEPAIQMEFIANLPWLLDTENTYPKG